MRNFLRTWVIAFGALLAATISVAQADPITFYVGGDIAGVTTKVEDKTGVPPIITGDANATTLRLKGGAHFLEWLDAEAHIVLPQEATFSSAGTTNKVKTSIVAVFAKPNINAGPVNIYALLGVASTNFDLSGVVSGNQSGSGVAYGVGAQYAFTKNISGSIDYTQYPKQNFGLSGFSGGLDIGVDIFAIGATYTFR